jgi:hypothetical protein
MGLKSLYATDLGAMYERVILYVLQGSVHCVAVREFKVFQLWKYRSSQLLEFKLQRFESLNNLGRGDTNSIRVQILHLGVTLQGSEETEKWTNKTIFFFTDRENVRLFLDHGSSFLVKIL